MSGLQHHDDSQSYVGLESWRWRTGRKVARNIYAVMGSEASDEDVLIGSMDTGALAREAVQAHNVQLDTAGRLGPVP